MVKRLRQATRRHPPTPLTHLRDPDPNGGQRVGRAHVRRRRGPKGVLQHLEQDMVHVAWDAASAGINIPLFSNKKKQNSGGGGSGNGDGSSRHGGQISLKCARWCQGNSAEERVAGGRRLEDFRVLTPILHARKLFQ